MNKNMFVVLLMSFTTGFTICYLLLMYDLYVKYKLSMQYEPMYYTGHHNKSDEFHKYENTSVADRLKVKDRVLCWLLTEPSNHERIDRHIKATWGKRCNILLFMSTRADPSLPSIVLPVKQDRNYLLSKTQESFKYIYKHYFDKADWFLKADDNTYVIVENLRYLLRSYNTNLPIYFGWKFKPFIRLGYMSGNAGYVLSKAAMRKFVQEAIPNKTICKQIDTPYKDLEMEDCLAAINVQAVDSRDSNGRERFFLVEPQDDISPIDQVFFKENMAMDNCSDNLIAFHNIQPYAMYVLEYLIYHLRPFGISYHDELADNEKKVAYNKTSFLVTIKI